MYHQLELFGPSRYHWDNGYFSLDIERRVNLNNSIFLNKAWEQVPEKLVRYGPMARDCVVPNCTCTDSLK